MRSFIVSFLVSIILLSGTAARSDDRSVFDRSEYLLGSIPEGGKQVFRIALKNMTGRPLRILSVNATCVYIDASADRESLGADEIVEIALEVDTESNLGKIAKTVEISTTESSKPYILTIRGTITHPDYDRAKPQMMFSGHCKQCHVGKNVHAMTGGPLYDAVCYACHKATVSPSPSRERKLRETIADGIPGTVMPGFVDSAGGPLTPAQVDSLVELIQRQQSVK